MTREEAIKVLIDELNYEVEYEGDSLKGKALKMAISAIRAQQDQSPDFGKMMPLTMDELNKRNDPVFVSIKDFPNGGYWCLCQNGYIIPPNGYGFMAKDRQNWVFYRQKPEEGTV